jgi:anti-anti-sigma factor
MNAAEQIIEVARFGDAVVLTPRRDLRELEFAQIQQELGALADDPGVLRVVVDFRRTDSLGSTALGMLVRLGQAARQRGGRLALCHLSEHEREIFRVSGLAESWPTFATLTDALQAVAA